MRQIPWLAWILAGLSLGMLLPGAIAHAGPLTLARDGQSDYSIAVPKDHSPALDLAAGEIGNYLEQMSGARLKIVDAADSPNHAIIVRRDASGPAGIHIAIDGSNVVISGRTDADALHAAYRFLDRLGCRFLAPKFAFYEGAAEWIPAKKNLVLDLPAPLDAAPALAFRKLYVESGHSHTIENLKQLVEWMPKVGYNTLVVPTNYQGHDRVKWDNWRKELSPELRKRGLIIEVGGHGYQNFINAQMEGGKLFQQHPQWFGQDESGERTPAPVRVFCTSNPQAVAYFIGNVLAYIKDRPEIQIYDLWPPDGAKWCACDACEKLGDPPDRQAILLKQVTAAVKPVRRDLRLEVIAYSSYLQPPAHETFDQNVLVDFCPISQQFDHAIFDPASATNQKYVQALLAWRKVFAGDISIYSYYRKYAWDSLPVIIPHYVQQDLQWYAKVPVQGVSTYCEPGDWFTYELNHFALAALAWDPDTNVDSLIDTFCAARYATEAPTAKSALATLERTTRLFGSVPNTSLKSAADITAARAEVDTALEAVTAAQARSADKSVERSLGRLALMCTYAARDLEIQQLRANHADRATIIAKATALHGFIAAHAADGVFLITAHRLDLPRMLTRYGVGKKH